MSFDAMRGLKQARDWFAKVKSPIDLRDTFVFGGLALVGAGVACIYAPGALIVCGAALFWLGVRK
jgi:hypothetical protein